MSMVNELLDDLQQKESAKTMPLDIPACTDAPENERTWSRYFIIAAFLTALALALFFYLPKWFGSWGYEAKNEIKQDKSPVVISASSETMKAETQKQSQPEFAPEALYKNEKKQEPIKSKDLVSEPPVSVRLQVKADTVTLWLQSYSPLDIGLVTLMPNQQQLVIKKDLKFDLEKLSAQQAKWLKIETRRVAGQTLLWLKATSALSVQLEPVKKEMGWFNYLLHIRADRSQPQNSARKKPQAVKSKKTSQPQKTSLQANNDDSHTKSQASQLDSGSEQVAKQHLSIDPIFEADANASGINIYQGAKAKDQNLLSRAKLLHQQGSFEQAFELIEQELEQHTQAEAGSDLIESRLWFLKQLLQQQTWSRFNALLDPGLELSPNNAALVKLATRAKLKQQDFNGAWSLLARLPVNAGSDTEHIHLLASIAYRLKDYDSAYVYYQQLIKKEPGNSLNLVGLARTLEAMQEPDKALRAYELAFQLGLSKPRIKNFVIRRIQTLQEQ